MVDPAPMEPCPHCGEPMDIDVEICPACGENPDMPPTPDVGGLIPVRNPAALWAYYLGVFSLLPCFPIGIAAFICGLYGLRRVRENPRVHGRVHAWVGVILGGICGLLWLVGPLVYLLGVRR